MSLLGIKISLSVVITEGDRNSDKAIGESHTANISRKTWSNKLNFFLFERANAHDCRNKKSTRIECVLVTQNFNQVGSVIYCRY